MDAKFALTEQWTVCVARMKDQIVWKKWTKIAFFLLNCLPFQLCTTITHVAHAIIIKIGCKYQVECAVCTKQQRINDGNRD